LLIAQLQPTIERLGTIEDMARLLRLTAVAQRVAGALDAALVAIDQSLELYQALRDAPASAKTLFERSLINQRSEQFTAALDDLERAQAVFQRLDNTLWFAFCAMERGLIAAHLGRYDQSIGLTQQARRVFVALELWSYVATCDLNLGNVAYYSGVFDLARMAYQQAEELFRSLGRRDLVLVSRRNQALILGLQGQPARSATILEELVPLAEELGDQVEAAELLLASGIALRDMGRSSEAAHTLTRAAEHFKRQGNRPSQATCQLELGWLLLEHGRPDQAALCFQQVERELTEQPAHLWRGLYGLGRCAEQQGHPDLALEAYRRACAIVVDLRRTLASEHASSGIFARARTLFGDTLRLAQERNEPLVVLETAERFFSIALERQLYGQSLIVPPELQSLYTERQQQLQRLLDADSASAPDEVERAVQAYIDVLLKARHVYPSAVTLPEAPASFHHIRERCETLFGASWSILYYIQQESAELILISIDRDGVTIHPVTLSPAARQALAQVTTPSSLFYTFLDVPFRSGQTSRRWEGLETLGAELLPPAVRQKLQANHRLLIVPSERLQRLPWAALRLDGAWLIERAVVQLAPSLRIWSLLLERTAASADAMLIGVSNFNGRAAPLASVKPSFDLVRQVWPGQVHTLIDAEVTRQGLLELAGSGRLRPFGLLHIATHGRLHASSGLFAHLKLRGEDLLYDDLTRLNLGGALVVLAACDGAAGEVLAGEEVLSLSRALLIAGARDVIASNYSLYDNGILKVLGPLYERLARGDDPPLALAYAQRQVIEQGHENGEAASSPLVWASFSALGAGVAALAVGGT
jgi:CHAT domain-containing protein